MFIVTGRTMRMGNEGFDPKWYCYLVVRIKNTSSKSSRITHCKTTSNKQKNIKNCYLAEE